MGFNNVCEFNQSKKKMKNHDKKTKLGSLRLCRTLVYRRKIKMMSKSPCKQVKEHENKNKTHGLTDRWVEIIS